MGRLALPALPPNKVMPSTEADMEAQCVSHKEDAGALCTAQNPLEQLRPWAPVVQGSGVPEQGSTFSAQSPASPGRGPGLPPRS